MKKIILALFLCSNTLWSQNPEKVPPLSDKTKKESDRPKTKEEKKLELVDFKNIKDLLKNDQLLEEADKKVQKIKASGDSRIGWNRKRYNVPSNDEIWGFLSEMWLVKRATKLKWDFEKPDYGLDKAFKAFLEKMGVYEVSFKVLVVDSPNIFHLSLPSNKDSYIFVLSLPFIRSMDLSKTEISILMFEDYLRLKLGIFQKKIMHPKLNEVLGSNFYKKKLDVGIFEKVLENYDKVIFDKGFSFQEQFAVTTQMDTIFRNDLKIWGIYYKLLQKIDDLVKANVLFKNYSKVYPSPELQMNWLKPKSKNL